jgi:hypothetical protein
MATLFKVVLWKQTLMMPIIMKNGFMKCLNFLMQILKDKNDFFHGCNHFISWCKHGFQTKKITITTIKIGMIQVCWDCHRYKNNQNGNDFWKTWTKHDEKVSLILSPNMKHKNQG